MVDEVPQEGLTADERSAAATKSSDPQLAVTQASPEPIGLVVGGQPGAGKTTLVNALGYAMGEHGGVFVIDPDLIRPGLPYMVEIMASGGTETPPVAYEDAGAIAFEMTKLALDARRHVLVDGTLQNTENAVALVKRFRDADYYVEFHGMAVYPDLSHARTYDRREAEIAASLSGYGRSTDDSYHHAAVRGYRTTVETFYDGKHVDRMALYDYQGEQLVDLALIDGQWTSQVSPVEVLDKAHNEPSFDVRQAAARTWSDAASAMAERVGQSPAAPERAELAKLENLRDSALHKVLQSALPNETYCGVVRSVSEQAVVQEVDGGFIEHDRNRLFNKTSLLKVGTDVQIKYAGKTGQVSPVETQSRSNKRGR